MLQLSKICFDIWPVFIKDFSLQALRIQLEWQMMKHEMLRQAEAHYTTFSFTKSLV